MQLFSFKARGMKMIKLEQYMTQNMLSSAEAGGHVVNKYGMHSSKRSDRMVATAISSTHYNFMPGPELNRYLYRGHNKVYPTCMPTLLRGNPSDTDKLYWYLKAIELRQLLNNHPAVEEMLDWKVDDLSLDIDPLAIAQHYGYKTHYLDLTRDKNIAYFFATHKFVNGNWKPNIGSKAQIIKADLILLHEKGIKPLGIYPFIRPFKQKGFLIDLENDRDLFKLPGVKVKEFVVTPEDAERAAVSVGGFKNIYPEEPLDHLLQNIATNRTVNYKTIQIAQNLPLFMQHKMLTQLRTRFFSGKLPTEFYIQKLENAGYIVTNKAPLELNKNQIKASENFWKKTRRIYLDAMKFRGYAEHYMK